MLNIAENNVNIVLRYWINLPITDKGKLFERIGRKAQGSNVQKHYDRWTTQTFNHILTIFLAIQLALTRLFSVGDVHIEYSNKRPKSGCYNAVKWYIIIVKNRRADPFHDEKTSFARAGLSV